MTILKKLNQTYLFEHKNEITQAAFNIIKHKMEMLDYKITNGIDEYHDEYDIDVLNRDIDQSIKAFNDIKYLVNLGIVKKGN